jgi:hypothetical protein
MSSTVNTKVSALEAIRHIAHGGSFAEIKDDLGIELDSHHSRIEWLNAVGSVYIFSLAYSLGSDSGISSKCIAELAALQAHVDQLLGFSKG